ncbi:MULTISPECIES: glycosyltransferase family 2 protein [unclassified Microbacterium]|uniref:glycosyltransferase family 2 protein n=1 Tax=unclassified Microbacterium TaxID=2609290 RepID=UPI003865A792
MPKPLVTAILPAKDAGPYIGTTLTTLARQFDDPGMLKIVVINDGSQDDTAAQVRHFTRELPAVEIVENAQPVGLAAARNQGLDRVEGDFFCFVDGDDWMQPLRLQSLVESMRSLECDFVRTDHVTDTDGRRRLVRAPFGWRGRTASPREAILPADETTMVDYPYAWAGMFHRRVLDDGLAHFSPGLFTAEDRPWIWRLHLRAASFAVVDAPAILYRRGVASSLTQVLDRRQLDFLPAFAQTLRIVEDDHEAERFLPKVATTTMSICAHHLFRARAMSATDRTALRRGIRDLLRAIPESEVEPALSRLSDRRRRILARLVREVRTS